MTVNLIDVAAKLQGMKQSMAQMTSVDMTLGVIYDGMHAIIATLVEVTKRVEAIERTIEEL